MLEGVRSRTQRHMHTQPGMGLQATKERRSRTPSIAGTPARYSSRAHPMDGKGWLHYCVHGIIRHGTCHACHDGVNAHETMCLPL
jgi:hypothetical protein